MGDAAQELATGDNAPVDAVEAVAAVDSAVALAPREDTADPAAPGSGAVAAPVNALPAPPPAPPPAPTHAAAPTAQGSSEEELREMLAKYKGVTAKLKKVLEENRAQLTASQEEVVQLRAANAQSTTSLASLQEEFRRYRIRSETLLRQKDDEVVALTRSVAGKPTGAVDTGALRDMEDKLEAAEARIQKMARAKAELQEQEQALREQVAALGSDLASARAEAEALKARAEAAEGEVETAKRAAAALAASATAGGALEEGSKGVAPSGLVAELEKVKSEYMSYRRRAMELLKEKDDQLTKALEHARAASVLPTPPPSPMPGVHGSGVGFATVAPGPAAGSAGGAVGGLPSHGGPTGRKSSVCSGTAPDTTGSGRLDLFASEATTEYLKNILLRYMTCNDPVVRTQLEAAIAAVMELTPSEISRVQAARKASSTSSGLWGLLGK